MSSPHPPSLEQLYRFDVSFSEFPDQLNDTPPGNEYRGRAANLPCDDSASLVDYLDEVDRHVALPLSILNPSQALDILILLGSLFKRAYVNLVACAVLTGSSRHHPCFHLPVCASSSNRLPREVTVMHTLDSSMVQRFQSNACGHTTNERPVRCIADPIAFSFRQVNETRRHSAKRP